MSLNFTELRTNREPESTFCTLQYRPQNLDVTSSQIAPPIVVVLKEEGGTLRFFAHSKLRAFVHREDLAYLDSLLKDFLERAQLQPEALFKQLSSLGVGPLVTQEAESRLSNRLLIHELSSTFIELK
jgi:hypothetical protein